MTSRAAGRGLPAPVVPELSAVPAPPVVPFAGSAPMPPGRDMFRALKLAQAVAAILDGLLADAAADAEAAVRRSLGALSAGEPQ